MTQNSEQRRMKAREIIDACSSKDTSPVLINDVLLEDLIAEALNEASTDLVSLPARSTIAFPAPLSGAEWTSADIMPLLEYALQSLTQDVPCDCDRSEVNICSGQCIGSQIWNAIYRARKLIRSLPAEAEVTCPKCFHPDSRDAKGFCQHPMPIASLPVEDTMPCSCHCTFPVPLLSIAELEAELREIEKTYGGTKPAWFSEQHAFAQVAIDIDRLIEIIRQRSTADEMKSAMLARLWEFQSSRAQGETPEETMKLDALLSTVAAELEKVPLPPPPITKGE